MLESIRLPLGICKRLSWPKAKAGKADHDAGRVEHLVEVAVPRVLDAKLHAVVDALCVGKVVELDVEWLIH